jgi:hypothetical protein
MADEDPDGWHKLMPVIAEIHSRDPMFCCWQELLQKGNLESIDSCTDGAIEKPCDGCIAAALTFMSSSRSQIQQALRSFRMGAPDR